MKLFVFCVQLYSVFILFGAQIFTIAQVCNPGGLRRFDANIAKLMTIGNSGRKFPESKGKELRKYCDQSVKYIIEIESYKDKCMLNDNKQVTAVLIYAVKNTIKQLCKRESQRLTNIIAATPCANDGNAEINNCYTKLIDSLLGIQNVQDDKKKVPLICCEYSKIFTCLQSRLKRFDKCTEIHLNSIFDFVRSITGNVIDLFCGEYTEGSDKCTKLDLPPKKRKNQRRTKSFALPMIDVLKTFKKQ